MIISPEVFQIGMEFLQNHMSIIKGSPIIKTTKYVSLFRDSYFPSSIRKDPSYIPYWKDRISLQILIMEGLIKYNTEISVDDGYLALVELSDKGYAVFGILVI